jgi:hypothetical protein
MEKALEVIQQKEVTFYDDQLVAVLVEDGNVYVPIRPLCDLLGIDSAAQRRRIQRDAVLSEVSKPCDVVMASQGQPSQHRSMLCLPLDFVSGFLFGINAQRVKPELKDRLIRYQKECYKVLAEAFYEGRLTADPTFSSLLEKDTPAVQAYKTFQALTKLAQNQVLMEGRLDQHEERLEQIEAILGDPGRAVTPDQASQISQAVKAVAIALGKQTKKNEFGAIYGELYRLEGITSYKQLPSQRFSAVMKWLSELYQGLTNGEDLPF